MFRSKFLVSVMAVATATTLTVVPAQALQTTVKDKTCTVKLSNSEQKSWDKAMKEEHGDYLYSDKNFVLDEKVLMPFTVKVSEAAATKKKFEETEKKFKKEVKPQLKKIIDGKEDVANADDKAKAEANLAVVEQMEALAPKYKKALDACAKGKTYDSAKSAVDENTSSELTETERNTLYGLLGLLGVAILGWFAQNYLPILLPRI